MRTNLPVTNKEVLMADGSIIVSSTDAKGKITFVNKDFLDISGFEHEELINQPHNIIRHPDMPSEAFFDMWETLKAGNPWRGYVKNRVKNGDHYWVLANAMPLIENGHTTGYISIRSKPDPQIVKEVEKIYKKFKDGEAGNLAIKDGEALDQSKKARFVRWFEKLSTRIAAMNAIMFLMLLFVGFIGYELGHNEDSSFLMVWTGAAALTVLAGFSLAFFSSQYLNKQLNKKLSYVESCMRSIMGGNYSTDIVYTYDETRSVLSIADALQAKFAYSELEKAEVERQKKLMQEELANNFQERVQSIISSVASAATELSNTAELMSQSISTSNSNAQDAVASAEETYQNVQAVAAASEEMSATIKEISSQTQNVNALITESSERVQGADQHATELKEASQQVHSVIQLISGISSQINLLALNATIESARAGEAGKGFAVVANEVRNLAGQTDKSIQDIEKVINNMSRASEGVVTALSGIRESVDQILASGAGVASAVEEQSAVVGDIAQNMNVATHKTESVKENITTVSNLSGEAEQSSQQVLVASQELSRQAETLQQEVSIFLNDIRAGT